MSDPNSERIGKPIRRHVRVAVRVGILFFFDEDPSRTIYEGETINISRGGACIVAQTGKSQLIAAADSALPKLNLSLYIDGNDAPISIRTQTAWISSKVNWLAASARENMPLLAGTAFEDLSAEDAEKIDTFVETCLFKDRESVQDLEIRLLPKIDR